MKTLAVGLEVLDPRQLVGGSELTPADTRRAVVDEGGMGAAIAHPRLLEDAPLLRGVHVVGALGVEAETPAAVPHPVVVFGQALEIGPGVGVERLGGELHGPEPT